MILLDTSGLLAALFVDQRQHLACADILREAEPPLVLSPFVLAELDYLVSRHAGVDVELELLAEVARGAYELAAFGRTDVEAARVLIRRYRDLKIGLTDASIVVLAHRYRTADVLTLDERHFRVLQGPRHLPFRVLPTDE